MEAKKHFFECYSYTLKDFLYKKGYVAVHRAIHYKTKNRMWLFKREEGFSDVLGEYSKLMKK